MEIGKLRAALERAHGNAFRSICHDEPNVAFAAVVSIRTPAWGVTIQHIRDEAHRFASQ